MERETNNSKLLNALAVVTAELLVSTTHVDQFSPSPLCTAVNDTLIMADISKPISFCEHLQLSSLGVQPASISFQVRVRKSNLQ